MSFLSMWGVGALVVLALATIVWLISVRLRNASIVDIAWGTGFVVLAWVYFALTEDGFEPRKILVAGLTTVWGLRLAGYIAWRNHGKGEDYRYARWRERYGPGYWWISFFQVFLLQGVIMWIVSAPLLAAQRAATPDHLTVWDGLAALVWLIGFIFEAGGDWQLARFKRNPANRGQVMDRGLWRYTRHPNYFGDAVQWWGFYLLAAVAGGWWTVFSPALMTYMLIFVSGVAMLERDMRQKPKYDEYMRRTPAFFPWWPRR